MNTTNVLYAVFDDDESVPEITTSDPDAAQMLADQRGWTVVRYDKAPEATDGGEVLSDNGDADDGADDADGRADDAGELNPLVVEDNNGYPRLSREGHDSPERLYDRMGSITYFDARWDDVDQLEEGQVVSFTFDNNQDSQTSVQGPITYVENAPSNRDVVWTCQVKGSNRVTYKVDAEGEVHTIQDAPERVHSEYQHIHRGDVVAFDPAPDASGDTERELAEGGKDLLADDYDD